MDESTGTNRIARRTPAGGTNTQPAKAAQEQNLIEQMKCESLDGKQKQDCITQAERKAGER
jgi:hypothetical protein